MLRFFRSEWGLPTIFLANAVVFLTLFWVDYTSVRSTGTGEPIGRVIFRDNSVDRKNARRVVWSRLRLDANLYNQDTIRSHFRSHAILKLQDGTDVSIDENTMIRLEIQEDGNSTIDFKSGSLQVKAGSGPTAKILSAGNEIQLNDSEVRIESGENSNDVNLFVKGGKARIKHGDEIIELDPNKKLKMDENSLSVGNLRVHLVRPQEQEVRPVPEGKKGQVRFSWKKDESFDSAVLQVSRDSNFNPLLLQQETRQDYVDAGLPGGAYYWRVLAKNKNTGELEESAPSRVLMVEKNPVELFSPAPSETIEVIRNQSEGVSFRWSLPSVSSRSVVEVSKDPGFDRVLMHNEVNGGSLNLMGLQDGKYYWRVSIYPLAEGMDSSVSPVNSFRIKSLKGNPEAPEPVVPENDKKIHPDVLKEEGLFLSWKQRKEANEYDVQVSRDPEFSRMIEDRRVRENYTTVRVPEDMTEKPKTPSPSKKEETKEPAGKDIFWRVRGVTGEGESSDYSPPGRVIVSRKADPQESQFRETGAIQEKIKPQIDPDTGSDTKEPEANTGTDEESTDTRQTTPDETRADSEPVAPVVEGEFTGMIYREGTSRNEEPVPTFYGPGSGERMVWPAKKNAVAYDVEIKNNDTGRVSRSQVGVPYIPLDMEPGNYQARIQPRVKTGKTVAGVGFGPWNPVRVLPGPVAVVEKPSAPMVVGSGNKEERIKIRGENYVPNTSVKIVESENDSNQIPSRIESISSDREEMVILVQPEGAEEGQYDILVANPGQEPNRIKEAVRIRSAKDGAMMSQVDYDTYVRSLIRTCGDRSIPDRLIRDCRNGYQILRLETLDDYDLYNYLKIKSANANYRISGYDYFSGSCPHFFRPAYELMLVRADDPDSSYGFLEKKKLKDGLEKLKACR